LPAARLGDSDAAVVGSWVLALGSPFGLTHSVSQGIISARQRHERSLRDDGVENQDFLQTDAAINPGNSGGPLVNASGDVVGMDTAVAGDAQNIGFALAIDNVKPVADKLRTGGTEPTRAGGTESTPRAVLGVSLQDDGSGSGAVIGQTAQGSPAAKAGLRAGDVVTAVDGKDISSADDLVAALKAHKPGDSVSITWSRQGTQHTAKVELAAS
ncbi:MAG TPA: PDZ domain-containing protein, partial [Acidimicrobiales bacterium]